jgi:hypothetical protein
MGQAADKIRTKELGPKRILPLLDETTSKVQGRGFGEFVGIGVQCRWHWKINPAECLPRE